MSYIDALLDRDKDLIHVVERVNGKRIYREYPTNYMFYYDDPRGKFRSIYGTPVSRFSSRNRKEFQKELKLHGHKRLYESDFKPVVRCLAENYLGAESPKLHTAFFDIEVDFHPEKGYSKPEDPFNAITAITVYLDWSQQLITMVLKPKGYSVERAQEICDQFENCFLFTDEVDLLSAFLDIIEDADILSGWNSEGFDIPYTIMRIMRVMSKDDTRRMCLWGQYPKQREYERFGATSITFDLIGRVHMDYLQLYRKYTYEERHSYALDAIGEYELGERKVAYEGTLDQLYNKDFHTFVDYNRQDTLLLAKLDNKLKFMDLANLLAHENTVLLPATMGAVAVTEQAIINEAHSLGLIVPNRKGKDDDSSTQAAGAYVAHPKRGMHEWIGSIDINSLYPSTIRALNMGPETIVGQVRQTATEAYIADKMADKIVNGKKVKGSSFADAWEGLFSTLEYTDIMNMEPGKTVIIDWEDGSSDELSCADAWKLVFESGQPWTLSANGTIFKYDTKGIIPGLLERWYAERKQLQAKKKTAETEADIEFWDKRQLVKKINLNSLYGALLNAGCRFFDQRLGQSTTLCGRTIAKHMDAKVNEIVAGKYDHIGEAIIYGDTDSCYFSAWPLIKDDVEAGKMSWDADTCIQIYDSIADQVNDSFPSMMEQAFHCTREHGAIIKGGREVVARKGLFIKKKRYAALIIDQEGERKDVDGKPGKVKAMGLDLKRSDTPKIVQDFLSEILLDTLTGADREFIYEKVRDFKHKFEDLPAWEKGTPKRVNNLTHYGELERKNGKTNMPGHVRAALNWNTLKRLYNDQYSTAIVDGMKTIVCKLKPNPIGYTSVGYPTDQVKIPDWFKELPFDQDLMESTIVDQKVENLLGVLNWAIAEHTDTKSTFDSFFSFE